MPTGKATGGEMIGAAKCSRILRGKDLPERLRGDFGNQPRPGRTTDLIADDPQDFALTCEPLHGQHEILSARSVNPAQPENQMGSTRSPHGFIANTCVNCHTIEGFSSGTIGPNLTHVGSRETIGAGILVNNLENLTRWVEDAQAIKPDCHMPNLDLGRQQSAQVAAYLEGLK